MELPPLNLDGIFLVLISKYYHATFQRIKNAMILRSFGTDLKRGSDVGCDLPKGYQWPFDPRKIDNFGSSLIDILVYYETVIKVDEYS